MQQRCSITVGNGGLIIKTPYDPGLVAALKSSIPATDRRFDPVTRAWVVAPTYGGVAQQLIQQYCGEFVMLPQVSIKAKHGPELLEMKYLGQCKVRDTGEITAFAWVNGGWNAIFPENVLRDWFEAGPAPVQAPDQAATLYAILGVARTATLEEIKSGFRKMARAWHPDVCREPNAHEMFLRVKEAADILSDSRQKARYDAGLAFEASLGNNQKGIAQYSGGAYKAPLRCGWVMCEGQETIGRFVVSKILGWEDITRGDRTLVTSWPMGADRPVEQWV